MFIKAEKQPMQAWEEKTPSVDARAPSLNDFFHNTTFHGVKYIYLDSPFKCRRVLWLAAVMAAAIFFTYQVSDRIRVYFEYQTTVNVEMKYNDTMEFPAVTLCNQNSYRETEAVDMNMYDFINEFYKSNNISAANISNFNIDDMNTTEFVRRTSHQLEDFVDSCTWNGQQCDLAQDFDVTITDIGVCYTFKTADHRTGERRAISEPGTQSGLGLILNVQHYEYMRGPQSDVGIKMLMHEPETIPLMKDMGFAAAPGTHTLVAIKRWEVTYMPHPYGTCVPDGDPISNCFRKCHTRVVQERCGCRDVYMEQLDDQVTICNLTAKFQCVPLAERMAFEQMKECHRCPAPCFRISFEPSLSYAHLSKFNIDRLVLTEPEKKDKVKKEFLEAREVSQRVVKNIVEKDHEQMGDIMNLVQEMDVELESNKNITRTFSLFAKSLNLPDILMKAADFAQDDARLISNRFYEIQRPYDNIWKWQSAAENLDSTMDVIMEYIKKGGSNIHPSLLDNLKACINMTTTMNGTSPIGINSTKDISDEGDIWNKNSCSAIADVIGTFFNCTSSDIARTWRRIQGKTYSLSSMDEMFKLVFSNASYGTDDLPGYTVCSEQLNSTTILLNDTILTMMNMMQTIGVTSQMEDLILLLGEMESALTNVSKTWDFSMNGKYNYHCDERFVSKWGSVEFHKCSTLEETVRKYEYMEDINENFDLVRQTMFDAKANFLKLSESVLLLWDTHKTTLIPTFKIIDKYQRSETTKLEMAEDLDSIQFIRSLAQISSISSELKASAQEFTINLDKIKVGITSAYKLIFHFPYPLLTYTNYTNLLLLKEVSQTYSPDIFERLAVDDRDFQASTTISILEQVLNKYEEAVDELTIEVTVLVDHMIKKIDQLKIDLDSFRQDNVIDVQFYMENFLRVDIFYRELGYQHVQQMPAFELLSLYSQVGGFLGLLLGASMLTVCELIDYMIMKILGNWHKQKAITPTC